ncbi:putative cyclin-B3-1 isoform X2 [Herrania umbratica]|uniref:Cyclin-B3-1 isoform X2 n=1 Tax=Herrania umbratica TaxID=108875 RepID=A0A6J1BJ51_9ROSI|nr:putative cyclin-B3-1 isoform X2 [Herrania umbratica]
MTSLKGKPGVSRADEHGFTRRSGFKIYSENEKPKNEASTMMKSAVVSKGAPLTIASDSKNVANSKNKRDAYANKIVQRKALADLCNRASNVSATNVYDGSKPMKNERNAFLEGWQLTYAKHFIGRVSMAPVARTVNVFSRKSFKGKEKDHLDQGAVGVHTSKTEGIKHLKTSMNDQSNKTKNSDHKSVVTTSRSTKSSLVPMRKSLPVLKKEKTTEPSRSMIKAKVCASAKQQANNAKSNLWRNRESDGFVTMPPKVQSNAAASILPRSFKPIVKTALRASNAQRTSKSKCSSGFKKPVSLAAISSEKDLVCSHTENNATVISNEINRRDLPSNGNSDASTNIPDILSRKKTTRRRSYTSLLMTRSKLLEDYGGVKEEEKLPGIDNDGNPLEVAQYVDEIYQYYWITEAQNASLESYMSIQTDITPRMRGILVNWLIEVHLRFDLMQETLYLMVTLLDRFLSEVQIKKNDMQLVGLTTLLLASKYEDFWHPRVKDLISISAETYTSEQMLKMEKLILKKLKFRLNAPTPYVFMLRFIRAAQSDTKVEHLAFYLIELCLVEYEALKFKASLLCASAIYVARCTLQMTPSWTPLLCRYARYDVSEIRECAEMILRFQKAARSGQLKVTYEKYMSHDLSGVAAIEPLDKLPPTS